MKRTYETPELNVTVFSSLDSTNAITVSYVSALSDVAKSDTNTVSVGK